MTKEAVNSACPYCGVGCGVSVKNNTVMGDHSHPTNKGALCVKGSALTETMDISGRLLYPQIHGETTNWQQATQAVADKIAQVVAESGPEAVAMYVSGQLLTEDYYVANKLMKGFIGCANIDTNSRLCMSSAVAAYNRAFGEDVVPVNYEDLEQTDLIVLVGSNLAWTHPIVFRRIQQAREDNPDLKLVVIDPRKTVTAEQADLFLQLNSDSDIALFNGLMRYLVDNNAIDERFIEQYTEGKTELLTELMLDDYQLDNVVHTTGIDDEQLRTFFQWFATSDTAVTVYCQGINQSESGTDKANSIINSHLVSGKFAKRGCGPFSMTGQPNAMGGREVGGLANQLAVHRGFDSDSIELVKSFWQAPSMATKPGLKAVDLFDAVDRGEVRVLWIMATNPVISLPDSEKIRRALDKCECVIVSDVNLASDTVQYGDILLPASGWGEKSGMVTNSERCLTRQRGFLPSPGEAKPDWWMICEVAKKLGYSEAFDFESEADIFREHAALSGINKGTNYLFDLSTLADMNDQEYQSWQPKQWPLSNSDSKALPLYAVAEGEAPCFATATGKAKLVVARQPKALVQPHLAMANSTQPVFWLNTGRQRDQWHTMTRTGHVTKLAASEVEPTLYMHPVSIKQAELTDGALVNISSVPTETSLAVAAEQSTHLARLVADEGLGLNQVFMSIHWAGKFGALSTVNKSIIAVTDPISGQPAYKSSLVKVDPVTIGYYGVSLGCMQLAISADYQSYQTNESNGIWRFAGLDAWDKPTLIQAFSDDQSMFKYLLLEQDWGFAMLQLVESKNKDASRLIIKAIHLFSPEPITLDLSELAEAIDRPLSLAQILGMLATSDLEPSQLVCSCFRVTDRQIKNAVMKDNLVSLEQVVEQLKCGTNCGSCKPEVSKHFDMARNLLDVVDAEPVTVQP